MGNVLFAGEDLKKRWKNLRDCFSKHLRSEKTRTGQVAKSICRYKSWPWAQHMEAFRPFLQFAQTKSNIATTDDIAESPKVVDEGIETSNIQKEATEVQKTLTKPVPGSAAKKHNLTLNLDKCRFSQNTITLLGYQISNKSMRPDPDRFKPLQELPLSSDASAMKRALGMFSHYSKWVPRYSDKIRNLIDCKSFPILPDTPVAGHFRLIKEDIAKSLFTTIQDDLPLTVETDASGVAVAATLSQNGRPVAFFSKSTMPPWYYKDVPLG